MLDYSVGKDRRKMDAQQFTINFLTILKFMSILHV